jgi:phosphonate transport system substrate-binding protein
MKSLSKNKFYSLRTTIALLASLALVSVAESVSSQDTLGSEANPVKISFVPGQDIGVLQSQGEHLIQFLEKETHLHFRLSVPYNFITVVETFGTKRTDVAMMNSFGYLLAHEKYGAQARLIGQSHGRTQYWGQIITAKNEIKKIEDIKGKKFAYVDPASTSGFVLPSSLFQRKQIEPKEIIFAGKHDSVVTAVYLGQVDAGATYNMPEENGEPQDARKLIKTQFPDVFKKVRILELTGPIPSDPVVFRKGLPADLEKKVIQAFLDFAKLPEGQKTLKSLYNIDGFKHTTDETYGSLRKMLKDIGKSAQDFLK